MPPTTDQNRAGHARAAIKAMCDHPTQETRNEYATQAKKLPVRIISAGLGQALAFVLAKKGEELLRDLGDWVTKKPAQYQPGARPDKYALLNAIINGDADTLKQYTQEAICYLQWLNRFAEAQSLKKD